MKCGKSFSIGGLITFGTTTSLFAKIVYEIQSKGADGQLKYFHKPWAMTAVMFMGMTFCLPLAYMGQKQQPGSEAEQPLLGHGENAPKKRNEFKETLMLSIPTIFDLIATVLMNVGLLYVTASVYQMMRGAEMLFAAFFAVFYLHRKLNKYHYYGLVCCVAGIGLVGSSSLLSGEGSSTQTITQEQMLMGMALIIISQAVQAAQLTFEDFFMADMDVAPMKIVGYEGFFGTIITLGIMMPIAYFTPGVEGEGFHEDIWDTLTMIGNSRVLQIILAVDMAALLLYNVSGMMVTGHMGAVFRTVLETMRTLFVWLVDLALFYGGFGLGESWSVYSWLQAAGFVVLVAGTLVYGKGDEEGMRQELEEAMMAQAAVEPIAAEDWRQPASVGPAPTSAPMSMPSSSAPMSMPIKVGSYTGSHHGSLTSSFRATQTIMAGSYTRYHHQQMQTHDDPPVGC